MEVLTANQEVLATVYRDSSDFLNDATPAQQSVILNATQKGLATLSSTHVALMEPWDSTLVHWKGGGYLDYVRSDVANERIASGEVLDFGGNPEWNHEAILVSDFRAFCIYPFGNPLDGVTWAEGLPVVPILEYDEPSPLGRAEWMKALAWLVGDEPLQDAKRAFAEVSMRYEAARSMGLPQTDSLVVLTGSVEQGIWSAPNARSFVAELLRDAGARYALADEASVGNVELSLESLYAMRGEVDALGLVIYEPDTANFTLPNWVKSNPHHAHILPPSGRVFAANAMTCDYFGWWVANPDAMLRNLRQVLYGEGVATKGTQSPCFKWLAP
jgi:iron complex transport system substrate-binding protein